jgi:hypothetical protein
VLFELEKMWLLNLALQMIRDVDKVFTDPVTRTNGHIVDCPFNEAFYMPPLVIRSKGGNTSFSFNILLIG